MTDTGNWDCQSAAAWWKVHANGSYSKDSNVSECDGARTGSTICFTCVLPGQTKLMMNCLSHLAPPTCECAPSTRLDVKRGHQDYDPFYDFDDDGEIEYEEVLEVIGSWYVPYEDE